MGECVRRKDWAATPFGPIESWPQSLRTATALMLESGFAMVVAWGPEFRFLYNDRYRPVLGNKHPRALGAPAKEIFPEVWDSIIGPLFQRTRRGESVAQDDLLIPLHRHGYLENCYFTIAYSPIRDESGGVGGMLAVVAETTERVQGERQLVTLRDLARGATEAKTSSAACLNAAAVLGRNALDVPFAVFYLLAENGATARRVAAAGISAEHPAAREVIEVASTTPGAASWPLHEAIASGGPHVVADVGARFGRIASGPFPEPVHTALVLPLTRPGLAQPYGFLVVGVSARRAFAGPYRDFFDLVAEHVTTAIANARAFEEERRRADALAEIDRAKTAFFSNVSHEFRTPLTLMLGPMEELLARGRDTLPDDTRAPLELAHRNSRRLLKLVNTLLDFSRLEAGRLDAHYEPVDFAPFVAELAGVFRAAIEKAGLRLRIECAPADEPAYLDRDMAEKIVFNLLSNALKFTLTGEIAVRARQNGAAFELTVSDTGVGIPERELPNLFQRFHRVENIRSRTHEGSGIGLALVHELVKLHGGAIAVASRLGEGTIFTVTFPVGRAHLPADRVAPAEIPVRGRGVAELTRVDRESYVDEALRWLPALPASTAPAMTNGARSVADPARPRILLADDNADMRDYVSRLLGAHYIVEAVGDGDAALAAVQRRRPDLVLTDVMMPGRDGFALLQALRRDPATRTLPVIVLSARAGAEATADGYEAGADDYLIKPFTSRELLARVAAHLRMSKLRDDVAAQERQRRSSESRSAQLLDLMPTAMCVCDGEGRVVFCNRRVGELLGRAPANGDSWAEFSRLFRIFPPEGERAAHDPTPMMLAACAGRVFRGVELEVERPDGSRFFIECDVDPVRDDTGRITGAVAVFQDVTLRKRGERNAAIVARLSQEVAFLADEPKILALATRLVGEHLGAQRCYFTEPEPDGARVTIHRGWSCDPRLPVLNGSYGTDEYGSAEFRLALERGTVALDDVATHPMSRSFAAGFLALDIRACLMAPFLRDGRAVARIVVNDRVARAWQPDEIALLENVVARIWPIVERARAASALRVSEERFRTLADGIAELAWTADRLGWGTWYNRRWYDYTGTTFEEMQGRGWERVQHPDHLARVNAGLRSSVERGEPWEDTFPLRGRDGRFRWFLTRAIPIRNAAGEITQWFGTNTDVTELRETQEALEQRTQSLEILNRTAIALSELRELEKIVQCVTAAGRQVTGAQCGAFLAPVPGTREGTLALRALSDGAHAAFASSLLAGDTAWSAAMFSRGGAVRVGDVRRDPRFAGAAPLVLTDERRTAASCLAVPVKSRAGDVLGWLFFAHAGADVFTAEAETAVSALAAQAAIAIDNADLYAALRTELERTREASLASRHLAAIVESSDDAIISKDLDGAITSWNAGAQRLFGYTADEAVGQPGSLLVPPDRIGEEAEILRRLCAGERVDHFETVRRRKDGALLDVSLTMSLIKDHDGRVVGASKIARDITARRQAEEKRRALYDMLAIVNRAAALPELYDAALNAVQRCQAADRVSLLLADGGGRMRFVAWRGLSEAYRTAVEGHSPWRPDERDPKPVCIADAATVADPRLREAIAREGLRALAFIPLTYEQRLIGKFMLYYDAPHAFGPDELQLVEAIATQVAFSIARQKGAAALEALVDERTASLRQAIAQMEEFSYSVSHDLRSPVRAMRGYAEAVLQDYGDQLSGDARELLGRIQRSGMRMDRLIQDLLTYSRISRREIRLEPVSLQRLIDEVVQQYPEMNAQRATIEVVAPLPDVLAHEPSLTQVVSNLLSNAVKFVPPGVRPRVLIGGRRRDGMVRVWFDDNGIGVKPEYQGRLFGMFERIHPGAHYEGTGIGLAIVRKAIERMNGHVGMESDGASGSRFWIELPAAEK